MFDWNVFYQICTWIGLIAGCYLFDKLTKPILAPKSSEESRDPDRQFYLEWIFLQKLIPEPTANQRRRVQARVLLIFFLSTVESFFLIASWKSNNPAWQMLDMLVVSVWCGMMLTVAIIGVYSAISRGRIEEKRIVLKVHCAMGLASPANKIAVVHWSVLLPFLALISLDHLSLTEIALSPVTPLLVVFIASLIWLFQREYLCSGGICAGFCFFKWDEIAWCRWYPDSKGVMIGVRDNCPFESWFVIELTDLVRERYLPHLREKLADKEIESVAEVLGLKIPEPESDFSFPSKTETHVSIS